MSRTSGNRKECRGLRAIEKWVAEHSLDGRRRHGNGRLDYAHEYWGEGVLASAQAGYSHASDAAFVRVCVCADAAPVSGHAGESASRASHFARRRKACLEPLVPPKRRPFVHTCVWRMCDYSTSETRSEPVMSLCYDERKARSEPVVPPKRHSFRPFVHTCVRAFRASRVGLRRAISAF